MTSDVEARVRAICLGLPEVTEKLTHGSPGFFMRKQFAMLWPNGHHDHVDWDEVGELLDDAYRLIAPA